MLSKRTQYITNSLDADTLKQFTKLSVWLLLFLQVQKLSHRKNVTRKAPQPASQQQDTIEFRVPRLQSSAQSTR